jgi:hypothetical protein
MNLIGEAMRQEARTATPLRREQVEHLAHRLLNLVRNMHRQIDTQITNARLLRLPPATESVSAACLLREAMAAHPFRHERERQCVELVVHSDFEFDTVRSLFLQVIDNLLRNALRALASLPEGPVPGDLRVEIEQTSHRWGCIRVIDRGIGIPPHLQARLFQPFVSMQAGTAWVWPSASGWFTGAAAACGWSQRSEKARPSSSSCRSRPSPANPPQRSPRQPRSALARRIKFYELSLVPTPRQHLPARRRP